MRYARLLGPRTVSSVVAVSFLLSLFSVARAGQKAIQLKEHLNREWTHEFVSYEFDFKRGDCHKGSILLLDEKGQIPVQVYNVDYWPNSEFIKKARFAFVVDRLAKRSNRKYSLRYSPKPVTQPKKLPNDLKVTEKADQVEITTSQFGLRAPIGKKPFSTPQPLAKIMPPILGFKLPDGTWFSKAMFYGDVKVSSWESKLTAKGPVFAEVETVYQLNNGNRVSFKSRLISGDYAAIQEMAVKENNPESGLALGIGGHGVALDSAITIPFQRLYAKERMKKLESNTEKPLFNLCSWPGDKWFPDNPSAARFPFKGKQMELQLCVRDPAAWVAPKREFVWSNFNKWTYEMIMIMWKGWMEKMVPVFAEKDAVRMRINLMQGKRIWTLGAVPADEGKRLLERFRNRYMSLYSPLPRLNEVKDMVLAWPDSRQKHPSLYMNKQDVAVGDSIYHQAYKEYSNIESLRTELDKLGCFDVLRYTLDVATKYDGVIDSGQISKEERQLFRAQMAYLGYVCADPFHWSFERGCNSGNPNMTVSRVVNVGMIGQVLNGHPMSKTWSEYAANWIKYWLSVVTSPEGTWPESSHYARVSWGSIIAFAIAARQSKLHDFFKDPKFKAMALYYEKSLTPRDPLRNVLKPLPRGLVSQVSRVCPPYGRGTRGDSWGLSGLLARATAKSDPEFSKAMQWSWRQTGFSTVFAHRSPIFSLYTNPYLPYKAPDWQSECFPSLGYILRSHVGSDYENYLLFVTEYYHAADGEIWPSDTGTIAKWYANGDPIGGNFKRCAKTAHVLMENRVMPACNWDPKVGVSPETGYVTETRHDGFASFPDVDYVNVNFNLKDLKPHMLKIAPDVPAFPKREKEGKTPMDWQRQILLVKGPVPGGVNYMILNDTVKGNQPSQWHFWTLSEKIGTPAEVANLAEFMKDAPKYKIAPLRKLKGDRFTAVGQFSSDLEYFIAEPLNSPAYTLRYGLAGGAYGVTYKLKEYQDLLHLQLPGDGRYYVALFPRFKAQNAPEFSKSADNKVIRITGSFGTDYCFLSQKEQKARDEKASFSGTAGIVMDRTDGLKLCLSDKGAISFTDYGIESTAAVNVQITPARICFQVPEKHETTTVKFTVPGKWKLAQGGKRVKLTGNELQVPKSVSNVTLVRQ